MSRRIRDRDRDGRADPSASAASSSAATRPSQAPPPVDYSLSQAEDVRWDEVDYDDEADAHQAAADRRRLQREMRGLIQQTTTDQAGFYEHDARAVHTVLDESSTLLKQTRQTTEAAIDATLVLRVSELAYKRTANFLADRQDAAGLPLEDFAQRCHDYMRYGRGIPRAGARELSRAQRRRRRHEALAQADDAGRRGLRDERARDQAARAQARADARATAARVVAATGAEPVRSVYGRGDDSGSSSSSDEGHDDDDDDNNNNDGGRRRSAWEPLDWGHFGQYACLPRVRRPALARFLPRMPPADEDGKARVQRKRTAALRLEELREVRPQVLRADELAATKKSENVLTTLATDILQQLRRAVARGAELVRRLRASGLAGDADADANDEQVRQLLAQVGIHSNGGVDLIRFAVNPHSFSQTVENLFYISFLVRDGRAGLTYDHTGLPSIFPTEPEDGGGGRVQEINKSSAGISRRGGDGSDGRKRRGGGRRGAADRDDHGDHDDEPADTQRHQMILSIDMAMWEEMIELFGIQEPMIEHRETAEPSHPGGRTWYT